MSAGSYCKPNLPKSFLAIRKRSKTVLNDWILCLWEKQVNIGVLYTVGPSLLVEVETVIDSRSKHEFLAKKGLGRVGRSTFLLGANQRLSGEGVFNGIYYCPLGFRAPCTCIPLCMRLVIVMFWLRASNLSIVNSCWHALLSLLPLLEHRAALWS